MSWHGAQPYGRAVPVALDVALAQVSDALYVGGVGNVNVTFADGSTAIFIVGAVVTTILPIRITKVAAANTTVTSGLLALYY